MIAALLALILGVLCALYVMVSTHLKAIQRDMWRPRG